MSSIVARFCEEASRQMTRKSRRYRTGHKVLRGLFAGISAVTLAGSAFAEDAADLAKKLSNPIASLISVPFQGNYNGGLGPAAKGEQYYVNVQPVVPFKLNTDWNVISRTIVPIIWQNDLFPGAGTQSGFGNITQSLFFSPDAVVNGFTWGAGPVLYLPTRTDNLLGPDKWAAGPTAVGLWQGNGWTIGMLANHLWSFAGSQNTADISTTFVQPFVAYTTKDAWTFTVNTESTYDWIGNKWSVPINAQISKLLVIDKQPISLFVGVRYWTTSPDGVGPTGLGARAGMAFLFPAG
jgi:hypothetical protein